MNLEPKIDLSRNSLTYLCLEINVGVDPYSAYKNLRTDLVSVCVSIPSLIDSLLTRGTVRGSTQAWGNVADLGLESSCTLVFCRVAASTRAITPSPDIQNTPSAKCSRYAIMYHIGKT